MLVIGRPLTPVILAICFLILFSLYNSPTYSARIRPERSPPQWNWPESFEEASVFEGKDSNRDADLHQFLEKESPSATFPHNQESVPSRNHAVEGPSEASSSTSIGVQEYLQDMLKWERPHRTGHWPPYNSYINKDYDPNRWQGFPWERGYYYDSGSRQFEESHSAFERLYSPYPDYQSREYRDQYKGEFISCAGPRGLPLNESLADSIRVYDAVPNGFPDSMIGSADAVGLHTGMCMDRSQRYGPYGFKPASTVPGDYVDWEKVNWGELQDECFRKNKERFAPPREDENWKKLSEMVRSKLSHEDSTAQAAGRKKQKQHVAEKQDYHTRTAILIRTWEGYDYADNDIMAIRAMVTELALQSGGEYQVFLMVNVKDRSQPIFSDKRAYKKMLRKIVPKELRDIAVLWSEEICEKLYPDVGDWQVYWQQWMPVQWFSENHPQFDFVWNWEMDVRYIGNHYHFLSQVADFATRQPRKYLWERNARFYLPQFHGSDYAAFSNTSNTIIAQAAANGEIQTPVWGAVPYSSSQTPLGPTPPHVQDADNFEWGVGEEADFLTLLPIWDPVKTQWTMRNKIWNFTPGIRPHFSRDHPTDDDFTHPSFASLPRRGYINTVVRLSRPLLHAMHLESLAGRSMQAEMWPSTVALHHGLKAVYVPHPIWSEKTWPARYADLVFNADGGVPSRWGQEADSIYNQDREMNFRSWSWYYHAEFPRTLYRRWMGWSATDGLGELGGPQWEEWNGEGGPKGKICLPPMLLHPVKRHDLEQS